MTSKKLPERRCVSKPETTLQPKLRRSKELADFLAKKAEIAEQLVQIQGLIFQLETSYLRGTASHGNFGNPGRGLNGFPSLNHTHQPIDVFERIFSNSSLSSMTRVNYTDAEPSSDDSVSTSPPQKIVKTEQSDSSSRQ